MNSQKLILGILPLLLLLFISSCKIIYPTEKDENGVKVDPRIPPDFGKSEHILLIRLSERKNLQKFLKKRIPKWYHGKYETIKFTSAQKYKDKDTYRYLLAYNIKTEYGTSYNKPGDIRSHYSYFFEFYVLDRKTNEKFKPPFIHNTFSTSAKSYLVRLEKARFKGN